jgi:AcrR family transcriptional regulator
MGAARVEGMPRRRGRPPKAEARDTRAALTEAALDLFARHGYAGTSIRAIAGAVGLSESVIYKHFPNKQAIFDEVLFQAGAGLLVDQLADVDPRLRDDPPAFLRAIGERLLAAWAQPRMRMLTSVLVHAIGDSHAQVIAATERVQAELAKLFARWARDGYIEADRASPEQLAWELFGGSALVRLLYLHADAAPATRGEGERLLRQHLDYFIATVFTGKG